MQGDQSDQIKQLFTAMEHIQTAIHALEDAIKVKDSISLYEKLVLQSIVDDLNSIMDANVVPTSGA